MDDLEPPPLRPRLLLVLDCDGTLLDSSGKIRPRVRDAVRAATTAGALVTLATGRRMQAARHFAEELGVRTPLVLQDGATVQDPVTGQLYHQDPLPPELIAKLLNLALAHGLHPIVQRITTDPTGDVIHVLAEADADHAMAHYLSTRTPVVRGDRHAFLAAQPVARFSANGAEAPVRAFLAEVQERVDDFGCVAYVTAPVLSASYPNWGVLVSNSGCSKARAVAVLAAGHGLTLADCVAIGDEHNDINLLREVRDAGGVSVAMGQSPPAVKAVATHVVRTNREDGVAEAIERYVLPRLSATAAMDVSPQPLGQRA